MKTGKTQDGREVRVTEHGSNGGANVFFLRDGEVVNIAFTGNKAETGRVLQDVEFEEEDE